MSPTLCIPDDGENEVLKVKKNLKFDTLISIADINKFLWMVRIGGSTDRGAHIKEHDYYTPQGEFRIDKDGSPTLLNCLMYKMCYYRFGQVYTEQGKYLGDSTSKLIIGHDKQIF